MDLRLAPAAAAGETKYGNSRLVGQFVLSTDRSVSPAGWLSDHVGPWCLAHHPALPAIRLIDDDVRTIGWMLGYPIDEAGRLLDPGESLVVPAPALASPEAFETFVYSFGGRFAAALLDGQSPRFYVDPCGSLSAVYCAHRRIVASTSNLIPYDEHSRDRMELARAIGIPYTESMYPFTLTPRHGVDRILPNHYLDLRDWRTKRHWPKGPLVETHAVEEAVAEIASVVKRQIAGVVGAVPTYLPLTAGLDSRMLLACARGVADRVELFTRAIGDKNSTIDCDTARRIAKRFRLRYLVLPMQKATDDDLAEWMFQIAYSTSEIRGWQCATMYKRLPGGHAVLGGQAGEVARGYYWRDDDSETTVITPERLLDLCACPVEEETLAVTRAWLESVPAANALQVLDLFFVEQDMGGWAGVLPYAESSPGFPIFPLCHRRVVERMLTLPAPYRRSGRLSRDIVAREWPELLDWPINQPIGAMRLVLPAKRAIQKAKRALRRPRFALS